MSGFHRPGRYCVQHKKLSRGGGFFFCHTFLVWRLRIGNVTDHRLWRMANRVLIRFSLFCRLTWVQRCWSRASPDFGSVSVVSSFLLQDIPRHPDTRLFEVREAFKRSLLLDFQAHIRAYIAIFSPPAALRGPSGGPPRGPSGDPCGGQQTPHH